MNSDLFNLFVTNSKVFLSFAVSLTAICNDVS